jgi:glycosyltransferase involved in cell wall biosynthesis
MNLISVVIPTCNRPRLLETAINSVINQTYNNIEIIIVDDASTDETKAVHIKYNDERISYIRVDKSKGGNFARNLGVKQSKGSYVAFLDDDDEWLPSKLSKQMQVFEKDESIGIVYTGADVIHTAYDTKYKITPQKMGDLSMSILTFNYIGTTSSVMIKRELFDEAGGFDIKMPQLQDYDLWIRVCQLTKVGFLKESLIKYYVHASTNQITSSTLKNKKAIEMIDKKYELLIAQLSAKEQKKRFCQRYNAIGKRKFKSGDKQEARKYFIRSFLSTPNIASVKFYIASFFNYHFVLKLRKSVFRFFA